MTPSTLHAIGVSGAGAAARTANTDRALADNTTAGSHTTRPQNAHERARAVEPTTIV